MLRNKADVRTIQKLLGHSSLDSTQVYTRVSITDLKEVHQRCHPREKDKE
jgi:integrase/recombinase XerD